MMVSVCAALEMMIYATAGFAVWRLRRTEPAADRPFRFRGGRWLALAFTVLFGVLALMASLTVGSKTGLAPLVTLVVIAGLVSIYVYTYLPRRERRDAEEHSWACVPHASDISTRVGMYQVHHVAGSAAGRSLIELSREMAQWPWQQARTRPSTPGPAASAELPAYPVGFRDCATCRPPIGGGTGMVAAGAAAAIAASGRDKRRRAGRARCGRAPAGRPRR
jgi:hypothetical protein